MSRPRSGGRSTPAARTAGGRPGVYVQSAKSDVYVALLGVALFAMITGCILLFLVLKRYDMKLKPTFIPSSYSAPQTVLATHTEKNFSVHL